MTKKRKWMVLVFLAGALGAGTVWADAAGGDIPILLDLLANSFEELKHLREAAQTAREVYDETSRLVGFAEDAKASFEAYRTYTAGDFGKDVLQAVDTAFPDGAALARDATGGGFGRGQGELRRLAVYCLGERLQSTACRELEAALTLSESRAIVARVFASPPEGAQTNQMRAMDEEAALALSVSTSQVGKSALQRASSRRLLQSCTGAASDAARCAAAADTAQIRALEAAADLGDQTAETNRLLAAQIGQANAQEKKAAFEALERRRVLLKATGFLGAKPAPLSSTSSEELP